MNKKLRYILLTVLIILGTILIRLLTTQEEPSHFTTVNDQIIHIERFSLNSTSTNYNTSANGSVFFRRGEGIPLHAQIVASIEIDPNDWGGVAFYIPQNWYVSNIKSSYPADKSNSIPGDYVSTWTTGDRENEWSGWIEVGRGRIGYIPTGGGKGTIVIDLITDMESQQLNPFHFAVEVGSAEKEGIRILGPDHIKIPIYLPDK